MPESEIVPEKEIKPQPLPNDSLAYSESEALQFSHPPRDSAGPFDLSPEAPEIVENEEDQDDMEDYGEEEPDMEGEAIERPPGASLELNPEELKQSDAVRKQLRNNFVRGQDAPIDPYADKGQERKVFVKNIQKDLRNLAGDPKGMKKVRKLSKKQLKQLKAE